MISKEEKLIFGPKSSIVCSLLDFLDSAHYSQDTDDAILEALCAEMSCLGDITDVTSVRESCLTPIIRAIPREMLNQGLEGLPQVK